MNFVITLNFTSVAATSSEEEFISSEEAAISSVEAEAS